MGIFLFNSLLDLKERKTKNKKKKECGDVSKYQSLIEQCTFELANAVSTHWEFFELYGTFANLFLKCS